MFKVVNKLLHKKSKTPLPSHNSPEALANQFADYFTSKIIDIRKGLISLKKNQGIVESASLSTSAIQFTLDEFEAATEEEVSRIIKHSPNKSCSLDPVPADLLKDCLTVLLPILTQIINLSLTSAVMPENLTKAILGPLLKKSSLDWEILKNFRPVSNLSFLSKLTEKVVAKRLTHHMQTCNLHDIFQSAYKQYHSTETALIRVQNDILQAVDQNQVVLLVLLDLSAAFDTVDHQKLLSVLSMRLGIQGRALQWFSIYINGSYSKSHELKC